MTASSAPRSRVAAAWAFVVGRRPPPIPGPGARVRVVDGHHFGGGHTGTITDYPGTHLGDPWWRMTQSRDGRLHRRFWVQFDLPVPDEDEPGHYTAGEVDERWLEVLQ